MNRITLSLIVLFAVTAPAFADDADRDPAGAATGVERETLPGSPAPQAPAPSVRELRLWVAAGVGGEIPSTAPSTRTTVRPAPKPLPLRGFRVEE